MKNNIFRSVEFWKESIMVLPDSAFFELLRSVFGKVKTPYNKQILLEDLEKFLSRPDIQENIGRFIDSTDNRIIAAVAILNEPVSAELETFFAGEISFAELNDLVVNLEERFILYRFLNTGSGQDLSRPLDSSRPQDARRIALNPVLESILLPVINNRSSLFHSLAAGEIPHDDSAHTVVFDDRVLASLLSFVSHNEVFFRYGGGIRRKVMNAAKELFPALTKTELPRSESSLETIIGGLQVLGLFFAKDENLSPDYRRFSALGGLSRRERMEYCAAGILCYWDTKPGAEGRDSPPKPAAAANEFSPWLSRVKVRQYASFIHCFYTMLASQRLYPLATLRRIKYIVGRNNNTGIDELSLVNVCVQAGLLVQAAEGYWQKVPVNENVVPSQEGPPPEGALIVMDSPFTFLVYPEIAYNDIIKLAAASCVVEAGSTVRFELNRDSAVLAFNRGITAETIIELLQRLSHNRIDENLIFTLSDWEKRHGEVMLRSGLVLTLAPEQRYLAETRPLAKLIVETLAPGIYMLPEGVEEKAADALRKAGIAIIARAAARDSEDTAGGTLLSKIAAGNFYPPLHDTDRLPLPQPEEILEYASSASTLIDGFHSILKQMRLGEEEREELAARVNRRLVLCESQLKSAAVRYEKLEARGLDYVGKALIAKQAITLQSPVEIIWPGRQKQERIFGSAKALEKTGGESILVVDPLNGGDVFRIPLGKISLLRRIKKSIFEGR